MTDFNFRYSLVASETIGILKGYRMLPEWENCPLKDLFEDLIKQYDAISKDQKEYIEKLNQEQDEAFNSIDSLS